MQILKLKFKKEKKMKRDQFDKCKIIHVSIFQGHCNYHFVLEMLFHHLLHQSLFFYFLKFIIINRVQTEFNH